MKHNTFRKWELALLMALCITLLSGVWAGAKQKSLSDKMIRLHIIAASDSAEDQALKLKIRDSILDMVTPLMDDINSRQQAQQLLSSKLSELEILAEDTARKQGKPVSAKAQLDVEAYPTRHYDSFSLPPGDYISLRITLDEGQGQNWWCVVFPPLCMAAAEESLQPAGKLTDEDISLISNDDYVIRFKVLELWGQFKQYIQGLKSDTYHGEIIADETVYESLPDAYGVFDYYKDYDIDVFSKNVSPWQAELWSQQK